MKRFTDKVVMVTGAGGGIGRASAERIAAEGGSVFCVDLNADAIARTVADIVSAGGEASAQTCDVSDEASVQACLEACVARYGSPYALINMAGILRFDDTEALETAHWQKVIDVNLTGTMLLCRAAAAAPGKNRRQYRQRGLHGGARRAALRGCLLGQQGRRAGNDAQYRRGVRQARCARQLYLSG